MFCNECGKDMGNTAERVCDECKKKALEERTMLMSKEHIDEVLKEIGNSEEDISGILDNEGLDEEKELEEKEEQAPISTIPKRSERNKPRKDVKKNFSKKDNIDRTNKKDDINKKDNLDKKNSEDRKEKIKKNLEEKTDKVVKKMDIFHIFEDEDKGEEDFSRGNKRNNLDDRRVDETILEKRPKFLGENSNKEIGKEEKKKVSTKKLKKNPRITKVMKKVIILIILIVIILIGYNLVRSHKETIKNGVDKGINKTQDVIDSHNKPSDKTPVENTNEGEKEAIKHPENNVTTDSSHNNVSNTESDNKGTTNNNSTNNNTNSNNNESLNNGDKGNNPNKPANDEKPPTTNTDQNKTDSSTSGGSTSGTSGSGSTTGTNSTDTSGSSSTETNNNTGSGTASTTTNNNSTSKTGDKTASSSSVLTTTKNK